jgi:hypothetical protein
LANFGRREEEEEEEEEGKVRPVGDYMKTKSVREIAN